LMQSIGGQIDVTSRLGSGSKFTVHLPRCLVADVRKQGAERS
jgi:chemotaxis protein histidine kinase CheA